MKYNAGLLPINLKSALEIGFWLAIVANNHGLPCGLEMLFELAQ